MEKRQKRFKLIVTDVEPTEWPRSTPDSFIDIKLAKGLKPCVRAHVAKTLADIIVHSHNTDNSYSAQKYKLTVADVKLSNSAWLRFRPCSIIDIEVAQGLDPLARARVESTLARVREFYVVGYPYPVVIAPPPPDGPFILMLAAVMTILLCGLVVISILLCGVVLMIVYKTDDIGLFKKVWFTIDSLVSLALLICLICGRGQIR